MAERRERRVGRQSGVRCGLLGRIGRRSDQGSRKNRSSRSWKEQEAGLRIAELCRKHGDPSPKKSPRLIRESVTWQGDGDEEVEVQRGADHRRLGASRNAGWGRRRCAASTGSALRPSISRRRSFWGTNVLEGSPGKRLTMLQEKGVAVVRAMASHDISQRRTG
jgi:hypothetical protein